LDWLPTGKNIVVGLSSGPAIEEVNVETGDATVVVPRGGTTSIKQAMSKNGWKDIYAILNPESSPSGNYLAVDAETSGGSVPLVIDNAGSFVAAGVPNQESPIMEWDPVSDVLAYTTGVQIAPPATDDWSVRLLAPGEKSDSTLVDFTDRSAFIAGLIWSPTGAVLAADGSDAPTDLVTLVDTNSGSLVSQVTIDSEMTDSLVDWGPTV
jgi:hypothetical protein